MLLRATAAMALLLCLACHAAVAPAPELHWHGRRQTLQGQPADASGRGGSIAGTKGLRLSSRKQGGREHGWREENMNAELKTEMARRNKQADGPAEPGQPGGAVDGRRQCAQHEVQLLQLADAAAEGRLDPRTGRVGPPAEPRDRSRPDAPQEGGAAGDALAPSGESAGPGTCLAPPLPSTLLRAGTSTRQS